MYITSQNVHTFSIESKFIKYLSSLKEIKLKKAKLLFRSFSSVKCFLWYIHAKCLSSAFHQMVHTCVVCYHEPENIYWSFVVSMAAPYEQDIYSKRLKTWKCSNIEFFLVWREHIYKDLHTSTEMISHFGCTVNYIKWNFYEGNGI